MNTVDLADVLAARLREAGYPDAATRRLEEAKGGGIVVRRAPSTTLARHYDGSRSVASILQVFVVRRSEAQAIEECQDIADSAPHLDLASGNGSYTITSVDVYDEPAEQLGMTGYPFVWRVQFRAIITLKG